MNFFVDDDWSSILRAGTVRNFFSYFTKTYLLKIEYFLIIFKFLSLFLIIGWADGWDQSLVHLGSK